MSDKLLFTISAVSFCGALAIAWFFDSRPPLLLAVLLASAGGALPLGVVIRRRGRIDR
ncbi:hypothetical protein GF356_05580 [candidate division GN15 bacterium]|nr:hypothetical protein [candidate division GN15 bacterium]